MSLGKKEQQQRQNGKITMIIEQYCIIVLLKFKRYCVLNILLLCLCFIVMVNKIFNQVYLCPKLELIWVQQVKKPPVT